MLVRGAWRVARIAGIDINVHWSFSFLVLWLILHSAFGRQPWQQVIFVSLAILLLFGCVALHELGHALTARWLNVAVKNVLILPIGGLVQVQSVPEKPLLDFSIAAAGPLVNLVLTIGCALLLLAIGEVRLVVGFMTSPTTVIEAIALSPFRQDIVVGLLIFLLLANLILFIFNLIPAFPMDGGRIMRALLSLILPYQWASAIAGGLGRLVAVLLILAAFSLKSWGLLVVGGLVLLTGYLMKVER